MKFSCVEITYRLDGEYIVSFHDLDGDRKNDGAPPHASGFYNFPRKMGKQAAFEALRATMLDMHRKMIVQHLRMIEKLEKLEYKK